MTRPTGYTDFFLTILLVALTLQLGTALADGPLRPGDTFKDCAECPELVVIPPGQFRMGDLSGDDDMNAKPVHQVRIVYSFAVGKHEVTQAQWQAVMGNNPSHYRGNDLPVARVTWYKTRAFIERLNEKTGQQYRLLSEAEWEYVARAGANTRYSWGDRFDVTKANALQRRRIRDSGSLRRWQSTPTPVGSYAPNAFGLYDMHGNAREWVEDCWNEVYYGAPTDGSVWTSGDCNHRVLRGGSFDNPKKWLRSAQRWWLKVDYEDFTLGFRVARTLSW